jgi:Ca-activated chloride channel family protein
MMVADPRWLWALWALPPLLLLEWRAARRAERALAALAGTRPDHVLLAQRRPGGRRAGIALRLTALALLILGAAAPEWGREIVRRAATGSDVLLLVDVSASMDVRDVAPTRLEEARREALAVLERLEGSRVAVVAFAGDAVRLCPLTQDLGAVRLVLESLSTASVSDPGTDLGRALRMARRVLPPGRREEQAIVLWTDGEDLERGAREALESLAGSGIRVFAVGVGTPSGDVIPVLDEGGRATDVKRDEAGNAVRSRLDEALLRSIARRTRGGYFSASRPGGELPRLLGSIGSLARSGRGVRVVERPVSRFTWCAGLAALLLALDLARPRRRAPAPARAPRGSRSRRAPAAAAAAALALALAAIGSGSSTAWAQSGWEMGNRAWRQSRFSAAESLYALRSRSRAPAGLRLNRATAGALAGRRDSALRDLAELESQPGALGEMASYNLGTFLGGGGRYDEALAALRRALERDPGDEDARWNYEVVLRRKREAERRAAQRPNPDRQEEQPPDAPPPSGPGPSQPTPQGSAPQAGTPPPSASQPPGPQPPPSGGDPGMTREQAERLLGALQDLARSEQQRQRRVRVLREKRGRDW